MLTRLEKLENEFEGLLFFNESPIHRAQLMAYSTDASVYQERPLAVAIPAGVNGIKQLISFASENKVTLIPRAAGTSLAGQVVGNGIVVDISKYFTKIIEVNTAEKWVRVQPGVIRDDLNKFLRPYNLFFGPETSTASRAMIGGMLGNNSCGLHSIVWGSVRDHVLEVKAILSDGNEVSIKEEPLEQSLQHPGLLGKIYRSLNEILSNEKNQQLIQEKFPKSTVRRRNSGYALDALLKMPPYQDAPGTFNLCQLIAGSEGTLVFATEIKLRLLELPPGSKAVVCIHCHSIVESMRANIVALQHKPMASELVDKLIMDYTVGHPEYGKNRTFIQGDPAAILMVEFMEDSPQQVANRALRLVEDLQRAGLGYAWPVLYDQACNLAWDIRKAGLGLLRNIKGDAQPLNLIEDCAVSTDDLPAYIEDLELVLKKYDLKASYYAHAGAGELHVEPLINLKSPEGLRVFRAVLSDTADLMIKYKGSLSGEHGDGRLRGEYISKVMGEEVYQLFQEVKNIFDPLLVFNAGKITDTPKMDSYLRSSAKPVRQPSSTYFDFSKEGGVLRLAEKCSGSGDCRRSVEAGGLMCPSYMATRLERDTTRARATVLRQFLLNEVDEHPFDHEEIKEIMDLCLSCKGCKTDCPTGVDITKLKAEFLQQYYDRHRVPFRSWLIANFTLLQGVASWVPSLYNRWFGNSFLRAFTNKLVGFHPKRTMPLLEKTTFQKWWRQRCQKPVPSLGKVYFFCDEFTNYQDVLIGQKTVLLLEAIGYQVEIPAKVKESGRTFLSKGLVKKAKSLAVKNIDLLGSLINKDAPLVGVEPSAILTFRDEYPDLLDGERKEIAQRIASQCYTLEEFLALRHKEGEIDRSLFSEESLELVVHGHCYQKVLSRQEYSVECLQIPINYRATVLPTGCCGMAGSFGYEKEHYDISQQVGELVLFPALRGMSGETQVVAAGTSCRHQIKDGVGKKAFHPAEILFEALKSKPAL
jgi:FAD/FMN-containing dehydrogenase/Fe-S oxidoreductase